MRTATAAAPGLDHALAVAEALWLELPLPGAAFWLALRLDPRAGSPGDRLSGEA